MFDAQTLASGPQTRHWKHAELIIGNRFNEPLAFSRRGASQQGAIITSQLPSQQKQQGCLGLHGSRIGSSEGFMSRDRAL
jgi:hypothetical protein